METVILFDVGGTWIRAATLADGVPGPVERRRTPSSGGPLVRALTEMARRVTGLEEVDCAATLISIPGTVDAATGAVTMAGHLALDEYPLGEEVAAALGGSCTVVNDTNAQGVGLAGDAAGSLLYLAVGTGIGGALIEGDRLVVGGGFAGEIGHVQVHAPGLASPASCYCGRASCLELHASGMALERRLGTGWWDDDPAIHHEALVEAAHLVADALDAGRVLFDPRVIHVSSFLCRQEVVRAALRERIGRERFPAKEVDLRFSIDPTAHALIGLARLATGGP